MRTIAHCRARGLGLVTACRSCGRADLDLARVCRAFDDFTLEELQRLGFFACPTCGKPCGVAARGDHWGIETDMEIWLADYGHFRRPDVGLSG